MFEKIELTHCSRLVERQQRVVESLTRKQPCLRSAIAGIPAQTKEGALAKVALIAEWVDDDDCEGGTAGSVLMSAARDLANIAP
jgi:hypothetical protein